MSSSVCRLQDQINDLRYGVVTVRSVSGVSRSYRATADTGVSRMAALAKALATTKNGDVVTLRQGGFTIANDAPMASFLPSGVTDVTVVCEEGAYHGYTDPEDASNDYKLFQGPRNIANFGAITDLSANDAPVDGWKALQAAANSLGTQYPTPAPILLESGRILRNGTIILPRGWYWTSRTWFVSPTVEIVGAGSAFTQIALLSNSFNHASDTTEKWLLKFDPVQLPAHTNNFFYSRLDGIYFACDHTVNIRSSGVYIAGGQGTRMIDCVVSGFRLRGVYANGCTFTRCWIPNTHRGPGLHWFGGGVADTLSVEHTNVNGAIDPETGEVYPAIYLDQGVFNIGYLQGEEIATSAGPTLPQTLCRIRGVVAAHIGIATFNVAELAAGRTHTMFRVTGSSRNVSVTRMSGTERGYFSWDVGTLVNDNSDFSPAGAGIPYIMGEAYGSYSQESGRRQPGLDMVNVFSGASNTFTGAVVVSASLAVTGALSVGDYVTSIGMRIGNTDSTNTIHKSAGTLAITTGGGALRIGVGLGAGQLQINEAGQIVITVPAASAGLPAGAVWNDAGTLKIIP